MTTNETKACWIWYTGDFEVYHSMLLNDRREQNGFDYTCMWRSTRPEFNVRFNANVDIPEDSVFTVHVKGKGYLRLDGHSQRIDIPVHITRGRHELRFEVSCLETFPALYIDSEYVKTGADWNCERYDEIWRPVGCEPAMTSPDDDPAVFPFSYEDTPVRAKENVDSGSLLDFGTETFGPVTVTRTAAMGKILISYGESREEALDYEHAIITETLESGEDSVTMRSRAFRYLFVRTENGAEPTVTAKLEYIPIEDKASFSCDDELLSDIWKICTRTFHLNSREFYLDGIKRDRWVWSGDAYQSYMVNRYLYFEPSIIRRTIRALLGKRPAVRHVNTINDYSAYIIIAVWEYYFATGDMDFVNAVWDDITDLYHFIVSRLDEKTGYVVGRPGDWIFIDWANIDKDGPLCAEQILLWQTYLSMARLTALRGETDPGYQEKADALKTSILRDYWDEERGAFIDSYTSGKNWVSRHPNIFAILYDFVDQNTKERIAANVLHGDLAEPITTPYFKFFELMALSKMGDIETTQNYIDEYWGGMLKLGATTVWEQFDPRKHGVEHLEMYGMPYGCSLCHAWGSGPIALLGQFCAGVTPTSVGYETFDVAPQPGRYQHFDAVVPVQGGTVAVSYRDGKVKARATVPGGTLKFAGKSCEIPTDCDAVIEA
ncbi:MAG: alpha-rhamnosidase [Clostridia bacterium]|nr:alpha-rhamnosidase [Clostridia bacterium]